MTKRQLHFETASVILSVILIAAGFALRKNASPEPWYVILLFLLAFTIGGYAKAKKGIKETVEKRVLNVEILMILAALGAFILGNHFEGAILILIFSVSGVLESYASSKSEKALTSLLNLAPKTALLYEDETEEEVLISEIRIGQKVIVRVGQQVPVDGVIVSGSTSLDQATITGEFVPTPKKKGDSVYAGSLNIDGVIVVETKKDPSETVVQKIIDFVQDAKEDEPKSQSKIKRIERVYVYVVILLSVLFMTVPPLFGWLTWSDAFYRGIIVLVVGSPCALVASIAPAVLASLSNGARRHILIKGGSHLEMLNEIDAVIFDKTGTITSGTPHVVCVEVHESYDYDRVVEILYSMEKQSNHPLAQAIVKHFPDLKARNNIETSEVSGQGIEAEIDGKSWQIGRFDSAVEKAIEPLMDDCSRLGRSLVPIIHEHKTIGFVGLTDSLRSDATEMIGQLKKRGIDTFLLTGDNESTAKAIAEEAGLDDFVGNCYPEDKVRVVKELQKAGNRVMMVGDGINDAPALAAADVSVAMGSATDISLETADIVFMKNDLSNLERSLALARRMKRIIDQNVFFSVLVIVLLLASNAFGLIHLPFGVIVHEMSTILVIVNSLRLLVDV
ncbi:MAG: heavy metal translocating P-type ATPase [Acholeplasmataceae bacterium]